MIGFVSGIVAGRTGDDCLIDVSGVGYRLKCSTTTLASLPADGKQTLLFTHLHVRDDALTLIGFASEAEQSLFAALLGVTGVGVKVALQICSAFTPDAFRRALATGDVDAIATVPGVGKKTAARVVLELKEKMALPDLQVVGGQTDALSQARSALEHLGYSTGEIRSAFAEVAPQPDDGVDQVVVRALKVLSP